MPRSITHLQFGAVTGTYWVVDMDTKAQGLQHTRPRMVWSIMAPVLGPIWAVLTSRRVPIKPKVATLHIPEKGEG